jgi:hypothetical protein
VLLDPAKGQQPTAGPVGNIILAEKVAKGHLVFRTGKGPVLLLFVALGVEVPELSVLFLARLVLWTGVPWRRLRQWRRGALEDGLLCGWWRSTAVEEVPLDDWPAAVRVVVRLSRTGAGGESTPEGDSAAASVGEGGASAIVCCDCAPRPRRVYRCVGICGLILCVLAVKRRFSHTRAPESENLGWFYEGFRTHVRPRAKIFDG